MPHAPAPLGRRFLSLFYEALALVALIWAMAFLYLAAEEMLRLRHVRVGFQLYLAVVIGIYFVWQWRRGGQTLAMKTWRLKLERDDGTPVELGQATLRYVLALAGSIAAGITFLWGFVDRDRLFLHDRLARTRIVRL